MRLKTILDNLYSCRSRRHLENDPLSFCHRYENPLDQEIVALIASSLAYGKVISIKNSLEKVLGVMSPSPRCFIQKFETGPCLANLAGFKHRFNDARDLCALFLAVKVMIEQEGTIGSFFMRYYNPEAEDLTECLVKFTDAVLRMDYSPVFESKHIPDDCYFSFFFPSPASGSACKRLCMFLRWMVRPADGIDLGLWKDIPPAKLIMPVDAHIQKIARFLGFTSRRQADWRMAKEITAALRIFDPDDPIKYDFSLCHIGITEGCNGRKREACLMCSLAEVCGVNQE